VNSKKHEYSKKGAREEDSVPVGGKQNVTPAQKKKVNSQEEVNGKNVKHDTKIHFDRM